MEALKAEMARKRQQMATASAVAGPNKKFFRRGDLEEAQSKEYWRRYYAKHKARAPEQPESSGGGGDETDEAVAKWESGEGVDGDGSEGAESMAEVRRKLRARGRPVRLFGELEAAIRKRLRQVELEAPELREAAGANDLAAAMHKVEEELLKEAAAGSADVGVEESLGDIDAIRERIASDLGIKKDPIADCLIIYDFYNYLLQRWGRDLNRRDEKAKRSARGRHEAGIHTQTTSNLRPLFLKLQKATVASDIRDHLIAITILAADGDYVRANNAYMEMAIGNAPWPVGVTRSGLHQRPGSARAYVKNIAHVLNDETQRKFIQGIKRLMTKCQEYFPSDPSRCIDYVSPKD